MTACETEYVESRIKDIKCPVLKERAREYHSQRFQNIQKLAWVVVQSLRKGGIGYTFPNYPQQATDSTSGAPARSATPFDDSQKQNAPLLQITGMVSDSEGQKADCQKAERNLSC